MTLKFRINEKHFRKMIASNSEATANGNNCLSCIVLDVDHEESKLTTASTDGSKLVTNSCKIEIEKEDKKIKNVLLPKSQANIIKFPRSNHPLNELEITINKKIIEIFSLVHQISFKFKLQKFEKYPQYKQLMPEKIKKEDYYRINLSRSYLLDILKNMATGRTNRISIFCKKENELASVLIRNADCEIENYSIIMPIQINKDKDEFYVK